MLSHVTQAYIFSSRSVAFQRRRIDLSGCCVNVTLKGCLEFCCGPIQILFGSQMTTRERMYSYCQASYCFIWKVNKGQIKCSGGNDSSHTLYSTWKPIPTGRATRGSSQSFPQLCGLGTSVAKQILLKQ